MTELVADPTLIPAPPSPGERRSFEVAAGTVVTLPDPAFDPAQARYTVEGEDLVVTVEGGGVLLLLGFFAHPEAPASLAVPGAPPVTSVLLLESVEVVEQQRLVRLPDLEPAAGPTGAPSGPQHGGGASFFPYDPGNIGPGFDALGPLGPTELAYGVQFNEIDNVPVREGEGERGEGPIAPTITARAEITGTLGEASVPFQLASAPRFPLRGEGQPVPDAEVNGLDQRVLTSDGREFSVVFNEEVARFKNSFGFYTIDGNGRFADVQILAPNVNSTTFDPQRPLINDGQGPLVPGVTTFELGAIPAGTRFGFFAIQKGFEDNPSSVLTGPGQFELRNAAGGPASLTDTGPLTLVKIAPNGQETVVKGLVFMTADAGGSPNDNPLNPDGSGHVISGFVAGSGVIFGIEDQFDTGVFNRSSNDRDFNDMVFTLQFGNKLGDVTFIPDQEAQLLPTINDPDSSQMQAAAAAITGGFQPGDVLFLVGFSDSNGDGLLDGTSIAFTQVSDTELRFEGLDTIENYELVLNGIRYDNLTNPSVGVREVTLTVTDDKGLTSQPFTVSIDIQDQLIAGDDNANTLTGTEAGDAISGRGGDDVLSGLGGDDLIDGGAGNDRIFGGDGNDILFGGTGNDLIFGGDGADRIVIGSLVFAIDTVGDFNQPEGDRLDLSQMFAGSNPFIPDDLQYEPGVSNDALYFQLADIGGGTLQLRVDLDGPGTAFDFQAIANLTNPTGVTTATPIQDIVITQPDQGSDGATS